MILEWRSGNVRRWATQRKMVLQVLPLGFVGLLGSLQVNLPRLFLENSLGLAELGYFTAIAAFYTAITRMLNTVAHSAIPRLANDFKERKRKDIFGFLFILGVMASVVGAGATLVAFFFGGEILAIMFTADYRAYQTVFAVVMLAAWLRLLATFWQTGLVASRHFWLQAFVHAGVISVLLVAAPILIDSQGVVGAAWAMVVGGALSIVGIVVALFLGPLRRLLKG